MGRSQTTMYVQLEPAVLGKVSIVGEAHDLERRWLQSASVELSVRDLAPALQTNHLDGRDAGNTHRRCVQLTEIHRLPEREVVRMEEAALAAGAHSGAEHTQ